MNDSNLIKMGRIIKEISMGPFGSDVKVECFQETGIPILNGSNLTSIKMNDDSFRFVSYEKANSLKKSLAHRGDIVVTHRGTLGQLSYIPDDSKYEEYLISQSQFRVTLDTDLVNPVYFAYYFHSPEGQKRLLSFENYVGVPALASATTNFRELEFPLIPKAIQDSIANTLPTIDSKIDLNISMCSDLQTLAKEIYDYWFVQFDFPDKNGKPYKTSGGKMVWNDILKMKIPEGWSVGCFRDLFSSINTGLNPRDNFQLNTGGNIKYLTVKNLTADGTVDFSSCDYIDADARNLIHRRSDVSVGDILFASIAPFGRCYLVLDDPNNWDINESIYSIRPNTLTTTSIHLYMSLMQDYVVKKLDHNSAGSLFKGIRISELQSMNILIPNKTVIDEFDKNVNSLFKQKNVLAVENQQLLSLRDFLLPMLMNGQITIR